LFLTTVTFAVGVIIAYIAYKKDKYEFFQRNRLKVVLYLIPFVIAIIIIEPLLLKGVFNTPKNIFVSILVNTVELAGFVLGMFVFDFYVKRKQKKELGELDE
jgi:multisubunit Na+/H+ antiporter MnhB subunit